jgi:hypothetical protein
MEDLNEIYAACVIEYVRRDPKQAKAGTYYLIGKYARDAFNLPYSEDVFSSAIDILEDIGALKRYKRPGMQTYYKIDAVDFDAAMKQGAFEIRAYSSARGFGAGKVYPFLEAFSDIGSDYLHEALETIDDRLSELSEKSEPVAESPSINSALWTGLPSDFTLSEDRQSALVRELDLAEERLGSMSISQEVRAQARAHIIAAKLLSEAPDPPFKLIWAIIGQANSLAGIASLFVSIIALFSTAAH